MTKITQFTKSTANDLSREAVEAIRAVAEKHGLTVEVACGQFGAEKFTAKFCFLVADPVAKANHAQKEFERWAPSFGVKSSDYNRTFTTRGGLTLKLIGFTPNRTKFPVLCETTDGKRMAYVESVLDAIREPDPDVIHSAVLDMLRRDAQK